MARIIAAALLVAFASTAGAQPAYFAGRYKAKLPAMKRAAALAVRNPQCERVLTVAYIPPKEQQRPGMAYLVTCASRATSYGTADLYFSESQLARGEVAQRRGVPKPAAIAMCRQALQQRYGARRDIRIAAVSDNGSINRRIDALIDPTGADIHAWCIVDPDLHADVHVAP